MRRLLSVASALFAVMPSPALAHGVGPIESGDLWTHWSLDPLVLAPLLIACWFYARGLTDLRVSLGRTAPKLPAWRVAAFLGGGAVVAIALISPLDELSGTLLSAHMVQHVLLVAVAPPLLVLGRPEVACFRGLPARWRRGLARSPGARRVRVVLGAAARPLPATALHGAMLWIWHAPLLFQAAAANPWLHWLEHFCFFGSALLFWRGLVVAAGTRTGAAVGSAAALISLVHSGFLAALLTLSPALLYPASTRWSSAWGMTPLQDQQLAGAIMWAPMGAIYLAAGLTLAARLLQAPEGRLAPSPMVAGLDPNRR